MLKEFREFAMRGNVVDLAVGVIIGGAFGAVTASLVGDLLMPLVGLVVGGVDFASLFVVLREGTAPAPYASVAQAREAGAVTLNYGVFINTIVNLVIVAFALFLVVKSVNAMRRAKDATPAPPPAPTVTEGLLAEIRDLLKARRAE